MSPFAAQRKACKYSTVWRVCEDTVWFFSSRCRLRLALEPRWGLAGKLDERFADAGDLLGGHGQILMPACFGGDEFRDLAVIHANCAICRYAEVPAVGADGVQHGRQVPRFAVIRHFLVELVSFA